MIQKRIKKLLHKIENNFRSSDYFEQNHEWIKNIILYDSDMLIDCNMYSIKSISKKLELSTTFRISSEFNLNSFGNQANIDLVISCNGKFYISGMGAIKYQDTDSFAKNNIELSFTQLPKKNIFSKYHNYGNAILDIIFNFGIQKTIDILNIPTNNNILS